jgi:hypothetical protein
LGAGEVPLTVQLRILTCALRELLGRGAATDWNQLALTLANLEGSVPRQLEAEFFSCLRQARLLAAQRKLLQDEDIEDYRGKVEVACREDTRDAAVEDKLRFLEVVGSKKGFAAVVPCPQLYEALQRVHDGIEGALPASFFSRVSQTLRCCRRQ